MKKIVIHGANRAGMELAMRSNYIFDICAFIDRNKSISLRLDNIPIYSDFRMVEDAQNIDYIFVMSQDYDGVINEYRTINLGKTKIMSMLYGHMIPKQRQFCALANEIYRRGIPGSVVELGVDYGETAKYINLFFEDRKLYLFDTFEGFNKTDVDYERMKGTMIEDRVNHYDNHTNENEVVSRMFYPDQCIVKKGYFPSSLEGLEDTFAFVHIDCDLSKPIEEALEYFYPRFSPGGFICVHDYFNPSYPGVREIIRNFTEQHGIYTIPVIGYDGVIICK